MEGLTAAQLPFAAVATAVAAPPVAIVSRIAATVDAIGMKPHAFFVASCTLAMSSAVLTTSHIPAERVRRSAAAKTALLRRRIIELLDADWSVCDHTQQHVHASYNPHGINWAIGINPVEPDCPL